MERRLARAEKELRKEGLEDAKAEGRKMWAKWLWTSLDGRGLREARKVAASMAWIDRGSHRIQGRDFVQHLHTWIGALPTRTRVNRGARARTREVDCRAGCTRMETGPTT